MTITERSNDRADDLADRLREEYGEFRVVEKEWRHPPGLYEDLVERFEADSAGGAGVWVYDDEGQVLLIRDEGQPGWTDPGGKRQADETFEDAARRVVRETTDLDVEITGVLELHRIEVYDGTDPDRPRLVEPIVIFEARAPDGEVTTDEGRVAEAAWFDETPDIVGYDEVEDRPIPFEG